jgi:hypothetical protein
MLRKFLAALGLIILGLTAGVFFLRQQGSILPGFGGRPIEAVIDAPLAGDSTGYAAFAMNRCRFFVGKQRKACYEEVLLATVERQHVRLAMDGLSIISRRDPVTQKYGHDLTHVVGINAWTPDEAVGPVYDSCTGLFQSGCYHGVVQAYLDANGTDSTTVSGLCNQINSAATNAWLRFQCVHGIGHGLVNNLAMHLPTALAGCDWLVREWDATSCYGGAFMEFIVAARGQSHHPHKPTRAAAENHEHDGHDMAAMAVDSFPARNRADPLYPCSVLASKYQSACYGMQAGIIIETVGPDFGKIAAACDRAPLGMRPACYQGVGTYVSGYVVRNQEKAINHCQKGNPAYKAWCFVGVVKNLIDVTALPDDGLSFCARLAERAMAVACYTAIGEQMGILFPNFDQREAQCAKVPAPYVPACRYGAVLIGERPPELTPFVPTA